MHDLAVVLNALLCVKVAFIDRQHTSWLIKDDYILVFIDDFGFKFVFGFGEL